MANSTGQNLVDDARNAAGYALTQFVTDAEVLLLVNERAKELYDLMNAQEESVYSTPYRFTLPDTVLAAAYTAASLGTPPVNYGALPTDCDRIQGLDFLPDAPRPVTVHMLTWANRNDGGFRYKAMGRVAATEIIQVMPPATSAGPYQLWYIPQFVPLTLSTTLDNNMQRHQAYVYTGAAIDILTKAKRDPAALERKLAKLAARATTMSQNRDAEAEQGGTDGAAPTSHWPYTTGPRVF